MPCCHYQFATNRPLLTCNTLFSFLPSLNLSIFPPYNQPFAEMYTQTFEKLFLANNIRRERAIRVLKIWNFLSSLAEADVTLGVAKHVQRRFNISPLELEEPTYLIQNPPPHVR